jgi:hypothetical protein
METQQTHNYGCPHCPNNKTAEPPFTKLKRIRVENMKQIEKAARAKGESVDCFACRLIQSFLDALN